METLRRNAGAERMSLYNSTVLPARPSAGKEKPMTPDETRERFQREIELRGYDDYYVDRNEEREILLIATQMGTPLDAAHADLARVCTERGYVLESAVVKLVRDRIEATVGTEGRLGRRDFDLILAAAREVAKAKRTDRQLKTLMVQEMEDTGRTRVRVGWFRNWYAALKRDLDFA